MSDARHADRRAARRALRTFDGAGPVVQAFLLARLFVAPLGPMDRELRQLRGRVLSLGCGHGIVDRYLAEINPEVTVDGVDLDAKRVAVARATADRAPRVSARVADVTALDEVGSYDAALAVDVLHHVPRESHRAIAAALYRLVEPGGQVLVKEMARTPRRQYLWNRLHDRIVAGPEPLACLDPEELGDVLESVGFDVIEVRRLRRLGLYPQYLVAALRPQDSTTEDPCRVP
jgi:2-polyprenyl-3-methyl-5-hydroxy-6-metoxy-1,4-benzoquinol methylase